MRPGASGLTVPNCESRVVDPETNEAKAAGEEGELWVRGPNVMLGYLGNDEATGTTITEDGWLRTGDLCVIDEDGYLFVRERVKELIKFGATKTDIQGLKTKIDTINLNKVIADITNVIHANKIDMKTRRPQQCSGQ